MLHLFRDLWKRSMDDLPVYLFGLTMGTVASMVGIILSRIF